MIHALKPPAETGLKNRCPRCGNGRLFSGYLKVAPECEACGLDYDFADSGDGPAVFIILFVGMIIMVLALLTEIRLHPPMWVHLLLWIPLAVGLSLAILRPLKGFMIAHQWVMREREARKPRDEGGDQ
jgi:uncharacterized protein (DUF983 family)